MASVSARTILDTWDLAAGLPAAKRVATLITSLVPDVAKEQLLDLSVGSCNVALLKLRAVLLGRILNAWCTCSSCGERFEFSVSSDDLIGSTESGASTESLEITAGGCAVRFRLLTQRDMEAAAQCRDVDAARTQLWGRCILSATDEAGVHLDILTLSAEVVQAVSEAISQADPCLEFSFEASCPSCALPVTTRLDVAEFLWTEIDALARRLLSDIDTLARRYHWSEADILDLSPRRRHAYLEMGQA